MSQTIEKLMLGQNNKTEEYMVHYRMLKFYFKLGVKLTKINRVTYVKTIYKIILIKGSTAKTEAEKDVRKLLNNSLYGRMCMKPLNFLQSKFLHDEENK